jgi:hypothetical protein
MSRHAGPLLVDAMVVIECWRIGAWRALAGGYSLETVGEVVTETQTGFQRRRREEQIDRAELTRSLAQVYQVTELQLAEVRLRAPDLALDRGEAALWAHTKGRGDAWILCGPDKASMRLGLRLGFGPRLSPLEKLLDDVGYRPRGLKTNFTAAWHRSAMQQLADLERGRGP